MREKVMDVLANATNGVTAQEIADETGLAKGKIVYGLTHYWANEIVKDTSGKSTLYRKA
jgi:predicted transcriptional regulator